jgi:hypothetical protein
LAVSNPLEAESQHVVIDKIDDDDENDKNTLLTADKKKSLQDEEVI